ncbi:MAG: DUF2975 domain-containing protein [Clostridia bacterium]|nr:DUF2975 domain-containing protein [Clostridia bacterium]
MENRSASLKKRISADRYCSLVFAIIEFAIGMWQIVRLISENDEFALKRSIHAFTGAFAIFFVFMILSRVSKTGKPFDSTVINYLRAASITIIAGGVLPFFAAMILGVVNESGFSIEIANIDILIPMVGITLGIVSEIFVYGRDLQEDNDLIA